MCRQRTRLCVAAVTTYVSCFGLLVWHGASNVQWRSGRTAPAVPLASPQPPAPPAPLCRAPASSSRTLLVEIPFTKADVSSLEISVALWERTWPCYRAPAVPSRPDLVLAFNSNMSEPRYAAIHARVQGLLARPVVRECFGAVSLESACLSADEDLYDKRRLSANWTVGPNNLFAKFLELAVARGYKYMVQLEPDIVPLRPLWLEKLHCVAAHSEAWVVGSPFLSLCARNTQTSRCRC